MDYAAVVLLEIIYMIAFLVLTSAGLAVVFGMMRVINLAHGEFVMIGGYTTIACAKADINIYFAMLVISPLVVGILGLLVERLVVRQLYGRMIDTMLATWGLSLLLVGIVTLIFGSSAVGVPTPIPGYTLGAYQMGGYNLFIIALAAVVMVGMWVVLRHTRLGLIARGAMQNPAAREQGQRRPKKRNLHASSLSSNAEVKASGIFRRNGNRFGEEGIVAVRALWWKNRGVRPSEQGADLALGLAHSRCGSHDFWDLGFPVRQGFFAKLLDDGLINAGHRPERP
jgi:hypothetical protein